MPPAAAPKVFPVDRLIEAAHITSVRALRVPFGDSAVRDFVRIKERGALNEAQADKWAIRLGLHPWEVWGQDWWDLAA
jgi:hypothetical protein